MGIRVFATTAGTSGIGTISSVQQEGISNDGSQFITPKKAFKSKSPRAARFVPS